MTRNPIFRRLATLVSGALIANLIIIAVTPLLSRLFTPDAFGQLAFFVSLAGILGSVMCLRYEQAVYIPESLTESSALVVGALLIAISLFVPLSFGFLILQWLFDISPIGYWFVLVPLASLTLALFNLMSNWAVREHKVRQVFKARVNRALTQSAGQASFGFLGWAGPGLILGDLLGRLAGLVLLFKLFFGSLPGKRLPLRGQITSVLNRHRKFPLVEMPGTLANVAVMQSPPLLLAIMFSPAEAGFYYMAQRLIAAPMAIVGQSAGQVYSAGFSRALASDPGQARRLFRKGVVLLLAIGGLPLVALGWAAQFVMPWLLGAGWSTSGSFILALLPFFIGQFVMSPFGNLLNLMGHQGKLLIWNLARLLLAVPTFVAMAAVGYGSVATLLAFGLVMGGMYIALWSAIELALRQVINESAQEMA